MNAPGPDLATSPRERALVSVVAAVFNEEGCIEELHRRVVAALDGITPAVDHEIVYVNDGSTDRSLELLHKLAQADPAIRVVDLSRNFGHQIAVTAGIDHTLGDAVVLIDSDLQDPPEVIPEMVERWRAGFKVVYGVRTSRDGETWFKRTTAHVHYWLLSRLSDVTIPEAVGDFRLMDRKVVDVLGSMREENRYLRGMVAWVGFQQCGVEYQRDPRHAGTTGYSLRRMISLSLDAITGFSERPLRIATFIGTVITFFGLAFAAWILISSLTGAHAVKGWPSLMTAALFIGGVQLLSLGIIGEYVGRVYKETKQRPLYVVGERINFDETRIRLVVDPKVSVCIPTYNAAAYIERTLRSALTQEYDDFEVVVCDDASTDGTLAIVERVADARVRIVRSAENLGAARNWDRAVGEARGTYVKLLCQDDTLRPTCLQRQAAALDAAADGTVALVACRRDLIDDHDRVVMRDRGLRHVEGRIAGRDMIRRIARSGTNPVGEPSATLVRRDVLSRSGGFDPSERYMIDVDMWARLLGGGDLHYVPESLCTFRLASTSWSARLARDQARQARHFVRKLRSRHPDIVGPVDVARGLVAATALGWGRRVLYWRNRRRRAP